MATYQLEHAKSGRASCKKCKEKIEKRHLRVGIMTDVPGEEYKMTKWYHIECFSLPRSLRIIGETDESFVGNILSDNTTTRLLADEKEAQFILQKIKQKSVLRKKDSLFNHRSTKYLTNIINNYAKIKKELENENEIGVEDDEYEYSSDHPQPPKMSMWNLSISPEERHQTVAYDLYSKLSVEELKDILRWNHQPVSGTKQILLSRAIDGFVNGRLGFCMTCVCGTLKLSENCTEVSCAGFYNEEFGYRELCPMNIPVNKATRLHPWYSQDPSESDKENMLKIVEDAKNPTATKSPEVEAAKTIIHDALEGLEWDMNTPEGIKKAAIDIMNEITKSSLIDLPDDKRKARMCIGKLILANKDKSSTEILEMIISQFGFKKTNQEATQRKMEALESVCGDPSNNNAMQTMLEISNLYFKEGNTNVGLTYRKVAEAIRKLDFPITDENSKGLGKGKTKKDGIGKSSAEKLYEFITTGTIKKLEEKRAVAL